MAIAKLSTITEGFGKMLSSPEVVAVSAAAFLTPLVSPWIKTFVGKIPFLGKHFTIAMFVVALVLFLIAGKISNVMVRAALIGLAGAFFIIALSPVTGKYLKSDLSQ